MPAKSDKRKFCKRGHERTPENVGLHRQCKLCQSEKRRNWKSSGERARARCEHHRNRIYCGECGGFPSIAKAMWRRAMNRAKRDGLPCTITKGDILEMIGDGKCPVFGTTYPLDSRKACYESASLDRFDSTLGYTRENCEVISWKANWLKSDVTADKILRLAQWMYQRAAA
jgi:hypothetical protein